jgi:hypothetical protein
MKTSLFATLLLLSTATSLTLSTISTQAIVDGPPPKAYINVTNNSDVDLQYYGCDSTNPVFLSYESEGGIFAGNFNQGGKYTQPVLKKNATSLLSLNQGLDQQGVPVAFPSTITLKTAIALPAPAGAISKICSSTDTTYIKSFSTPISAESTSNITITGNGPATTFKKGFVNATTVSYLFNFSQELHQPLQNTTSQLPKIILGSGGQPVQGAKICVNGTPTAVNIDSSNQYFINLLPNTTPVLTMSDTPGTGCQATVSPLTMPSLKSNFEYQTSVIATTTTNPLQSPSGFTIYSTSYTPYQKGIYATRDEGTNFTQLTTICVDDIVTNESESGSKFFLLGTGSHKIQSVNSAGQCDTSNSDFYINTPDTTLSNLLFLNVHDKTQNLNVTQLNTGPVATQQPTIQSTVSTTLFRDLLANLGVVSTGKIVLQRDINGNLSLKSGSYNSSDQDLITMFLEFDGPEIPVNTTVTYKPITNPADLTEGGAGLPINGTQITMPFELVITPKPTNLKNINLNFTPEARTKIPTTVVPLRAYASNSPFVPYPVIEQAGGTFATTIPGGFKQLAVYEDGSTTNSANGLIRTGGENLDIVGPILMLISLVGSCAVFIKLKKN